MPDAWRHVAQVLRTVVRELSGGLGDLATFLPLAVGLIAVNHVSATSIFLSAGLLYIAAGLVFRLPIPVQPLKATSAIAIALAVPADSVAATAVAMGALFLAISAFSLDDVLDKVFSRPIVRGIQLGLAVLLVKGGLKLVFGAKGMATVSLGGAPFSAAALFAAASGAVILLSGESRRYPAALVVLAMGLLGGLLLVRQGSPGTLSAGASWPVPRLPADWDARTVFLTLLLPQVPLTLANSVVATAATARQYFGESADRVTPRRLMVSLGTANLFVGLLGGMPLCHGCGGLTAHYRFGARSGLAGVLVGGLFVLLGILFGNSITVLVGFISPAVLGILLLYVGVAHARLLLDIVAFPCEFAVALAIGAVTLVTGNLAIASGLGLLLQATGKAFRVFRIRARAV